jgi:hypothetical protein
VRSPSAERGAAESSREAPMEQATARFTRRFYPDTRARIQFVRPLRLHRRLSNAALPGRARVFAFVS